VTAGRRDGPEPLKIIKWKLLSFKFKKSLVCGFKFSVFTKGSAKQRSVA